MRAMSESLTKMQWPATRRGVRRPTESRYSTGDVYGKGLPSHVVFVVGVEEEIIDDKMQQVIGRVSEWQLAVD
jgi:hypothetical protein